MWNYLLIYYTEHIFYQQCWPEVQDGKEILVLKKTHIILFFLLLLPLFKTEVMGSVITVSQQGFLNVAFCFFFILHTWLPFPLTTNEASRN